MELFAIFPFLVKKTSIYDQKLYNLLRRIRCLFWRWNKKDKLAEFKSDINNFLALYRTSIKDYNKNLKDKDKNKITFTFKLHNLYHYPKLIEEFSPLKHSSTIRGERFHQTQKYSIAYSKSKKNVPKQIMSNWSILYALADYGAKNEINEAFLSFIY